MSLLAPSPRDGVLTTLHSPRGHYVVEHELAVGAHSTVFLAHLASGSGSETRVALKRIDRRGMKDSVYKLCVGEATHLERLRHAGIVLLHEAFCDGPYYCLVMDHYPNGDLLEYVGRVGYVSERRARVYTRQLALALDYAHRLGIIHRDVKLENVLMDDKCEHVVLCDWGYATTWTAGRRQRGSIGSPHYAAPEMLKDEPYEGPEVDSWSLGAVVYAMTTGTMPFLGKSLDKHQQLVESKALAIQASYAPMVGCSDDLQALIKGLFNLDQVARYTIREVLDHAWLTGVDIMQRSST